MSLNTPKGYGPHGRPATLNAHGARRETKPLHQRRWADAQALRPRDCVLGGRGGIYVVLGIEPADDGTGRLKLTVDAPSGAVRTWLRDPDFQIERA